MIVVTAATGQLCRLVVRHLLELVPAEQIAVVARDPARAAHPAEHGSRYASPTTTSPGRSPAHSTPTTGSC